MPSPCLQSFDVLHHDLIRIDSVKHFPFFAGEVQVTYSLSHVGHDRQPAHLTLQVEEKDGLAGMLMQGLNLEQCLDKVRDKLGAHLTRMHLATTKDLHNIAKSFGLHAPEQLHSDDSLSVISLVNKMHSSEGNPVIQ